MARRVGGGCERCPYHPDRQREELEAIQKEIASMDWTLSNEEIEALDRQSEELSKLYAASWEEWAP